MTDKSDNTRKTLTEDQMEQLLNTFYKMELPQDLDVLPSSWPELTHPVGKNRNANGPSLSPAASAHDRRPASTASRGIAVAVATLAACLMLMVFGNLDTNVKPSQTNGTIGANSEEPVVVPDDATFHVHGGENDGALDENRTSLKEIEQIDLAPHRTLPSPEEAPQGR